VSSLEPVEKLSRKELIGPVGIAGMLILTGLGLVAGGIYEAVAVHRTGDWPSVEGVTTESYMAETQDGDGTHYDWILKYAYSVAGCDLVGSRRFACERGRGWTRAARASNCRNHPVGLKVTVHYNPVDPEDCVLRTDDYGQAIEDMAIGLGMALFCGLGLAVFLRACMRSSSDLG